ncbi:muropeptide transporter [bacterium BMS3Abin13]|nr:muropeptide transporter [bacterium BMS3Abin13]
MTNTDQPKLLKSKMFWVGILYFAEGFPLGMFYDVFPVHFRQQGVELWKIGFMSLLGLAWTLKFLWAPAVDHYRHHRRWMFGVELLMGGVMLIFASYAAFGTWVWFAIGAFTLLSATNDIAIDGYTIEMLNKSEMGFANGLRIGFYRVGMLAAGFILILSDYLGWSGTYICAAVVLAVAGTIILLYAPSEKSYPDQATKGIKLKAELKILFHHPLAFGTIVLFLLGVLWLIDSKIHWSAQVDYFWWYAFAGAASLVVFSAIRRKRAAVPVNNGAKLSAGPMFGTLLDMLQRPHIIPVIIFILIFKLGDSAMGFMVKPFWVDAGFSASQIGFVSVNLGLVLSVAGGLIGGWITDRIGIFRALWVLGLFQAFSNLGYVWAAHVLPVGSIHHGVALLWGQEMVMYTASGIESFTGGLGTAAFLAFLMAIVNKQHSATEYALLSSIFALSRSLAGWASGFGAQYMGYSPYFALTFFLAFPAYFFLPWVQKMLRYAESREDWHQE